MEFDLEAALSRLKQDFIESSLEKLDDIDTVINNIFNEIGDPNEQLFQLQRDVHSIKGSAGTHGLHVLTVVAHRLEDFLEAVNGLTAQDWRSVQLYIDEMRALVDSGEDPKDRERDEILHRLPHARIKPEDVASQNKKKVTILVVMQPGVQRKVIGKELSDCGFDLSFTDRPVEAIRLILDLQPDAVLSNHELRNMTGTELANALHQIKQTRDIPFALLTASDVDPNSLPSGTHIVKKGGEFISDLTEYFMDIGLFGRL